jgi:hypothetical protein
LAVGVVAGGHPAEMMIQPPDVITAFIPRDFYIVLDRFSFLNSILAYIALLCRVFSHV